MTAKQRLRAHIDEMHGKSHPNNRRTARATMAELQRWHAREHHRWFTNHYHAGPNTDASNRPPGWYTGEDSMPNR